MVLYKKSETERLPIGCVLFCRRHNSIGDTRQRSRERNGHHMIESDVSRRLFKFGPWWASLRNLNVSLVPYISYHIRLTCTILTGSP